MNRPKKATTIAFALGVSMFAGFVSANAEVTEITIIEAGGQAGDAVQKGFVEPFEKKTGIRVVREGPGSIGKLRSLIASGNVDVALFDLSSAWVESAKALDLIEPLDWAAIDPDPMLPIARGEYRFGYQIFSTVMVWRSDAKAPANWQEFWDVTNFPGKRALPDYPHHLLPIALMADGVAPKDLYPLDLDRAFASLDKIKPHVAVWWTSGAQPFDLLKQDEIQYAVGWHGRAIKNEEVKFSFHNGLLNVANFTLPKGVSPEKKKAAMLLLKEMSKAENQLAQYGVLPYPGSSPDLQKLLPQDAVATLPTSSENFPSQVEANAKWWFDNAKIVESRWLEYKLTR